MLLGVPLTLEVDLDKDLRYLLWAGEEDAGINVNTDSEN